MNFQRTDALQRLVSSINNGMIKIITGPRRCGKSYLLFEIFKNYLLQKGVKEEHILSLRLDTTENARYRDLDEFTDFFRSRKKDDGNTYFFLIDEIQFVKPKNNPWVKGELLTFYDSLNEFLSYPNTEVFVTGSNSHMLSKDIATEFRGRGWQIPLSPLSYSEIREEVNPSVNDFELWDSYWKYGGLPQVWNLKDEAEKRQYLRQVFLTTYLKDIIERNGIKNATAFEDMTAFLAGSVGSLVNPTKIANTLESKEKVKAVPETIRKYFSYLEDAFLIRKAERYDLKKKELFSNSSKIYFEDMGIRNAAVDFKGMDQEPHFMENIVFNELVSRGYLVHVGSLTDVEKKNGQSVKVTREVDFVIEKDGKRYYIQSAFLIDNEEKLRQEKESFKRIPDAFPRIIISKFTSGKSYDDDGVMRLGLFDFLKDKNSLTY